MALTYHAPDGQPVTRERWYQLYRERANRTLWAASKSLGLYQGVSVTTSWVGVASSLEGAPLLYLTRVKRRTRETGWRTTLLVWSATIGEARETHADLCRREGLR